MNHAVYSLFFAACVTFSLGCAGPMWNPGCGTGCSTACDDGCGACGGCGELYVDPWINNPADCCDPCDACGNFNGQSCGKCRPVFAGVKSLWGYRCEDNCGSGACGGGCDSAGCDGGGCDSGCGGGGDCGCSGGGSGHSHSAPLGHPGPIMSGSVMPEYSNYQDPGYDVRDGETLVESSISGGNGDSTVGDRSNARISTPPRISRRNGQERQIFQPRRVNESRPLAY